LTRNVFVGGIVVVDGGAVIVVDGGVVADDVKVNVVVV